jgi:hypothetical protein
MFAYFRNRDSLGVKNQTVRFDLRPADVAEYPGQMIRRMVSKTQEIQILGRTIGLIHPHFKKESSF